MPFSSKRTRLVALLLTLALLGTSVAVLAPISLAGSKSPAGQVAKKKKKKKGKKSHREPDKDNRGGPDDGDGAV